MTFISRSLQLLEARNTVNMVTIPPSGSPWEASGTAADAAAPLRQAPRVVCIAGFGTSGVSASVARKFGLAGFNVALMARREDRLQLGVEELRAAGIVAHGFSVDLSDPSAVRSGLSSVARQMGAPVEVLHWNPYNSIQTPLLQMTPEEIDTLNGVALKGLLAAVQELLPQWTLWAQQHSQQQQQRAEGPPRPREPGGGRERALPRSGPRRPALLVTGGGLALDTPSAAAQAVEWGVEGIAIAKAAQHKLVAVLRETLRRHGVFVGQVTILGVVRGTAFDSVLGSSEEEAGAAAAGPAPSGAAAAEGAPPQLLKQDGGRGAAAGGPDGRAVGACPMAFVTAGAVADLFWRLYEARPEGPGWHAEIGGPAAGG